MAEAELVDNRVEPSRRWGTVEEKRRARFSRDAALPDRRFSTSQ
jgi:hypothetical protein